MSNFVTPTTELEAVNIMLRTIKEAPVNSLLNDQIVDAVVARDLLRETSREVQTEGWYFNTEINYPIAPNAQGELRLPENGVRFKPDRYKTYDRSSLVIRGRRLYDRTRHSFRFTEPVYGELLILLPFDELPETARRYVLIKAARVFVNNTLGEGDLEGFALRDEYTARSILMDGETEDGDHSIIFDEVGTFDILRR